MKICMWLKYTYIYSSLVSKPAVKILEYPPFLSQSLFKAKLQDGVNEVSEGEIKKHASIWSFTSGIYADICFLCCLQLSS